jgi:hypothetical protein|nr:MAG TPA: hypothetical protein [Bacteriophage sp.]
MKFEDAKVGMKVHINHPKVNYNEGIITSTIGSGAVFVEPLKHKQGDGVWFWEGTDRYSLNDLTLVKNKVPKFDIDLVDSKDFQDYVEGVIAKYEGTFLPEDVHITYVSINKDGKIVTKDNKGNKGISKCHPDDAFNLEIGLKLAIQRLAEKAIFVPEDGKKYYSILLTTGEPYKSTFYECIFDDLLNKAMGNCFRTEEEAEKNKDKIISRYKTLLKYAERIAKGDN